jgi:hypothetical protein
LGGSGIAAGASLAFSNSLAKMLSASTGKEALGQTGTAGAIVAAPARFLL